MSRYRAVLRLLPPRNRAWAYSALDAPAVTQALGDGLVSHRFATNDRDETVLDITLERPGDQQFLNDLFALAEQYGYSLVAGEAAKLVARTVDGLVTGAVGGVLPGAAKDNPLVAIVGAALGGLAGWAVGSQIRHAEVLYRLERDAYGSWILSPVPRAESGGPTVGTTAA